MIPGLISALETFLHVWMNLDYRVDVSWLDVLRSGDTSWL